MSLTMEILRSKCSRWPLSLTRGTYSLMRCFTGAWGESTAVWRSIRRCKSSSWELSTPSTRWHALFRIKAIWSKAMRRFSMQSLRKKMEWILSWLSWTSKFHLKPGLKSLEPQWLESNPRTPKSLSKTRELLRWISRWRSSMKLRLKMKATTLETASPTNHSLLGRKIGTTLPVSSERWPRNSWCTVLAKTSPAKSNQWALLGSKNYWVNRSLATLLIQQVPLNQRGILGCLLQQNHLEFKLQSKNEENLYI